ncbi:MAG: NAD(P)-dependent oxidoreductase [Candidatus Omnitrophica bacterium]|nr:NAD(P)-dependent oxidoreductase [Candidatus Omnitrophota bacterium]
MKNVAVVGAAGFVGTQVARAVAASGRYNLISVLRNDPAIALLAKADIVVYAANPARRFQAEKDPMQDFEETVEKTAGFLALSHAKRFVLVSTLSCRTQLNTSYGRNRRACELIALQAGSLVIRLGPMYGGDRIDDTLHKIISGGPVFVAAQTRYAYVDVSWVGKKIVELLDEPGGIREIGARNAISLGELRDYFSSKSTFSGIDDTQIPEGAADGPDARDIFRFAEEERRKGICK